MRVTHTDQTKRRKRRSAFTLMEVLVVVAILVVLAGVAIVSYMRIQEDSYRRAAKIKAEEIEKAAAAFMQNYNQPATSLNDLVTPPDGGQGYIKADSATDPWGQMYIYRVVNPGDAMTRQLDGPFLIYSMGPNRQDDGGSGDDIGSW